MRRGTAFPRIRGRPAVRAALILAGFVGLMAARAGSAADVVKRGETAGFRVLTRMDVGKNPHQITFTSDGATAYIAAAGSDRITQVDARSRRVVGALPVAGTPLGVVVAPSGKELFVSRFGADRILRFRIGEKEPVGHFMTGGAPSLLVGPYPGGKYLVSAEKADRLWVLDSERFVLERGYPTGSRPFPPSATSDGRLAFVPNYNDGTVTVVDLRDHRVFDPVKVGGKPSGGAVLPGDREYAVAVRAEDRIVFVSAASRKVVGSLKEGIGRSPFSVVLSLDGRLAFINNTASHDVSVLLLPERRVVARIPVGEIPIVMAVHPSGDTLWVSSEGSHELSVIEIPEKWRSREAPKPPLARTAPGGSD